MATVEEVAGRFSTVVRGGVDVRLLLAKNPAGWTALFDLLDESGSAALPTVLSVNARIADGLDTSWLWDVPFERLRGERWWPPASGVGTWPCGCGTRRSAIPWCPIRSPPSMWPSRDERRPGGVRGQLHGLRRAAGPAVSAPASPLTVVVVFPDLLGTYGDGGNGLVLARRAAWRGIDVELVEATSDRPIPAGDIYCLGGGEDGPQVRASRTLIADGTVDRAVDDGAVVLGVCAGFQLLGRSFPDAGGWPTTVWASWM